MKIEHIIDRINNYTEYHRFSTEEFCRLAGIDIYVLNKIINREHYVSLHDYKKIAFLLDMDLLDLLSIT